LIHGPFRPVATSAPDSRATAIRAAGQRHVGAVVGRDEIGDGNSPATMAVEASVAFDVAVYPIAQWPLTSPTVTRTSQTTDVGGLLTSITDAALTTGAYYRVCIRRVGDGEVWAFTMQAT